MPHGDTCVSHLYEPGAIPASAGMTPILPTMAEPPSGQATVAATIVEAAAATDAATGIKITAIGAITEAATATSIVNAGLAYSATIVEAATAADVLGASVPLVGTVAESASAAETPNASVISGVTYSTWDTATVTAVTLSSGNLVATNTGTTSADQGARVASASGKTSGKYYFEATLTTFLAGVNAGVGIGTPASTYTGMGGVGAQTGNMLFFSSGNLYANASATGYSLGARVSGNVIGIAIDLDNRKAWFRVSPAGTWSGTGGSDPATNVGGHAIPAGTMVPFVTFGGTGGVANNVVTAKFGASAFSGAVPSGFTAGWPA